MSNQLNHELREFYAWNVLIKRVKKEKPITYKELAENVSVYHRVCRYFLERIQNYLIDDFLIERRDTYVF